MGKETTLQEAFELASPERYEKFKLDFFTNHRKQSDIISILKWVLCREAQMSPPKSAAM